MRQTLHERLSAVEAKMLEHYSNFDRYAKLCSGCAREFRTEEYYDFPDACPFCTAPLKLKYDEEPAAKLTLAEKEKSAALLLFFQERLAELADLPFPTAVEAAPVPRPTESSASEEEEAREQLVFEAVDVPDGPVRFRKGFFERGGPRKARTKFIDTVRNVKKSVVQALLAEELRQCVIEARKGANLSSQTSRQSPTL